ncbi:MbcA/ParS/Xre antitoxin family protein [Sediminicoccus sp. KRV36]|uniref:MbcA/ParS/Xre antitoxin family protein n=1 Tax=Sediminicoccus sp. KRV36 TaxID=3133721 RepID=UPI00200FAB69|nr:MbcA/ParS/Xre antitoxin family protein [Sediminicoccus rosea]UPY37276.1 MbcA/ParS/Xre antitoxin family protein [Sediminicoccus rosea]
MPSNVALPSLRSPPPRGDAGASSAVVSKAVVRAAGALGLRQLELAHTLGISPASASRLMAGQYLLPAGSKPFEMALLVIRAFRSLSGVLGDQIEQISAWMRVENRALGGVPAELIGTVTGLVNTVAYLDAARARI